MKTQSLEVRYIPIIQSVPAITSPRASILQIISGVIERYKYVLYPTVLMVSFSIGAGIGYIKAFAVPLY